MRHITSNAQHRYYGFFFFNIIKGDLPKTVNMKRSTEQVALLQLSFLSSMGSDFEPQRPQLRQQQKQNPIMGIKTMKAMPEKGKGKT